MDVEMSLIRFISEATVIRMNFDCENNALNF